MRLASAAGALVLLSCAPAYAWGSLETTGSNTHACLDKVAYWTLSRQPTFNGDVFPKQDVILAHEGVEHTALNGNQGPGPDSDGVTYFSEHYYNPVTDQGRAPESIRNWFVKLASRIDTAKAAAWSGHFLADLSVPYHLNGMFGAEMRDSYMHRLDPKTFYLPDTAVGSREHLSRPLMPSLPVHSINWQVEAGRYLAAEKDARYLDWFDPWYWNGTGPGPAIYAVSSHLSWEGVVKNCPPDFPKLSSLWPGNPAPTWDHASHKMGDVVFKFAKRVAQRTYDDAPEYLATPSHAEMQATGSIATLWRASYSALRAGLSQDPDPAPPSGGTPSIVVRGKFQNLSDETASGVEMKLAIRSGSCKRKEPELVRIGNVRPGGPRYYGYWHLSVPDPKNCQLRIGAIGGFKKTPDLQLDWHDENVTVKMPEASTADTSSKYYDPCYCDTKYNLSHGFECRGPTPTHKPEDIPKVIAACHHKPAQQAKPQQSEPVDCLGADYGSEKCMAH